MYIKRGYENEDKPISLTKPEQVLNAWKSFIIMWHRACNNSNAEDFFQAAKNAKWFEYNLRQLSLWQAIKFVWLVRQETDVKYRDSK